MSTDKYQRLRDALDAGPTPGPWFVSNILGYAVASIAKTRIAADQAASDEVAVDAAYIAAASPDTIAALLAERDRLRAALTFVRRGIESGHIEFSPIVLDQSGCFKQERRRLTDVVNAALGDANAR